jgi:hypothetical protein
MEQEANTLLAAAPELLASGYITAITPEALAEWWLESQFASFEADEPGGADSWSAAECNLLFDNIKGELTKKMNRPGENPPTG